MLGLFSRGRQESKAVPPVAVSTADPAAISWLAELFGGRQNYTGVSITPENVLGTGVGYAAVAVISQAVAQLPLHVHRRTEGGKERATDHPLYELLSDQPNEWTSAYDFRAAMTSAALRFDQGAFAFVNRVAGKIVELVQIPSPAVRVETDPLSNEPIYRATDRRGQTRVYDRTEILHLRTPDGVAPLTAAADAIGTLVQMERHQAKLFARGGRPSGSLTLPKGFTPEATRRLATLWNRDHAGDGGGGTALLEEGVTWTAHEFKSTDAQFLELRQLQIVEIARPFRIPPFMLQDYGRATWANAEEAGRQFLTLTLLPWLECWRGAMRRTLLTPEERATLTIEFLIDDLARANLADRMEAYAKAITNGILSPNEVRAMENRAPYSGGDDFRLPMNTETPGATE